MDACRETETSIASLSVYVARLAERIEHIDLASVPVEAARELSCAMSAVTTALEAARLAASAGEAARSRASATVVRELCSYTERQITAVLKGV